jgi:hypothetical protein
MVRVAYYVEEYAKHAVVQLLVLHAQMDTIFLREDLVALHVLFQVLNVIPQVNQLDAWMATMELILIVHHVLLQVINVIPQVSQLDAWLATMALLILVLGVLIQAVSVILVLDLVAFHVCLATFTIQRPVFAVHVVQNALVVTANLIVNALHVNLATI